MVLVPARLRSTERDVVVDQLVQRLLRRAPMHHSDDRALEERSEELADKYLDGVRATSIRWVGNQRKRWGSCNPNTGQIRISDRLRPVPSWVLDAVLVHELAHLVESSHSRRFRALTKRYPRMAEADTFLHGFTIGLEVSSRHTWNDESADDDESAENDEMSGDAAFAEDRTVHRSTQEPGRLFDPSAWDRHSVSP